MNKETKKRINFLLRVEQVNEIYTHNLSFG